MKYMVLIYGDEGWTGRQPEAEQAAHHQRWMDHSQELQDAGVVRDGAALQPTATATTVRGGAAGRSSATGRSPRRRSSSAATT